MIKERILALQNKIEQICQRVNRDPKEIILVGVTKYTTVENIKEAVACGITHIGENKVQDAKQKFALLDDASVKFTKHMIGHLQTNKVKMALQTFDVIQSVDSLKLAKEIEKHAEQLARDVDIFLEINCSGEEQKFGIPKSEALPLVEEILKLKRINIRGLMTMAPFVEDSEIIRQCFRDLKVLGDEIAQRFKGESQVQMNHLSMGMTQDYEIALEEGANMLRIGSAIFA